MSKIVAVLLFWLWLYLSFRLIATWPSMYHAELLALLTVIVIVADMNS